MDNLIFVSAQPDLPYFHWQVELYLYQFSKHGIQDRCYAIFGYKDKPSDYIVNLSKRYNIFWYKDERTNKTYIPSIRPHILKKFFKDKPELGKNVFYHDADIFIVKLPKFELLLNDDIAYLSDTISYIGYNHISDCCKRYKDKYPNLPDNDLLTKMCECIEIPEELVKENENNSGGAQYLLKDIDWKLWEKCEISQMKLFDMLKKYESKYPIDHHIQSWTADMWCVLWEYWKLGKKTLIHSELDFSWATSSRKEYHEKNIFHLAGVTSKHKNVFYKGKYKDTNIFEVYKNNKNIFDDISPDSSTIEYVNIIKEVVDSKVLKNSIFIGKDEFWSGVYERDTKTRHFDNDMWRSTNKKYIIFWNSDCWILTGSQYESEISKTCGGYISFSMLDDFTTS